ncbi:MAG: hypothetical protein HZA78_00930 [Candidatus Schekmanbacteria bacterium]|nr:hypothetical protein [Candidatus Schekmanbacteria bacterium]
MYSYKFNKLILIIFLIFFCLGFSLKPITTKGKWLNTLLLKKEFKTIILESDKFLISEPNNLEIRIILAMAYQLTGQIDEAMNQAKIILDKDETNIPANEIFMFSLMEKKHFEEGLAFAKKILQTDPNNAEAYYLFGWYNYEKGDEKNLKEAIEYFTKAGELDPKKELMTTDNIISIHMILHEFEKAEILAKKFILNFQIKNSLKKVARDMPKKAC